jgi:hypothetical protein
MARNSWPVGCTDVFHEGPRRRRRRRGPTPSVSEAWGRSVQRSPKGTHAAQAASSRCERQRTPAERSARRAHPPQGGLPLRPFRPVERSAEQSRKAVFNRRRGARILRGLRTTARSENATNVTGATPRARWLHSGQSSRIMRGERLSQRGKSESRAGWTEHCISRVQRTGECGAELWTLPRHFPPTAGIRAAAT